MLNNRYRPTKTLRVPELSATFDITGQGTPYLRKNGSMQKVGFLLLKKNLLIDYADHTLTVGYWNDSTDNFDYTIKEQ